VLAYVFTARLNWSSGLRFFIKSDFFEKSTPIET